MFRAHLRICSNFTNKPPASRFRSRSPMSVCRILLTWRLQICSNVLQTKAPFPICCTGWPTCCTFPGSHLWDIETSTKIQQNCGQFSSCLSGKCRPDLHPYFTSAPLSYIIFQPFSRTPRPGTARPLGLPVLMRKHQVKAEPPI